MGGQSAGTRSSRDEGRFRSRLSWPGGSTTDGRSRPNGPRSQRRPECSLSTRLFCLSFAGTRHHPRTPTNTCARNTIAPTILLHRWQVLPPTWPASRRVSQYGCCNPQLVSIPTAPTVEDHFTAGSTEPPASAEVRPCSLVACRAFGTLGHSRRDDVCTIDCLLSRWLSPLCSRYARGLAARVRVRSYG